MAELYGYGCGPIFVPKKGALALNPDFKNRRSLTSCKGVNDTDKNPRTRSQVVCFGS
jgi:hypothetical protein